MAGKKQLPPVKIVREGGEAGPATVSNAASRLDELRAMRKVLAGHIDSPDTLARDLAPLMRQAREISVEIEDMELVEAESGSEVGAFSGASDAVWRPEVV